QFDSNTVIWSNDLSLTLHEIAQVGKIKI
ncbi:hypothetical protein EZS27_034937, partial [termite gut metagenome]